MVAIGRSPWTKKPECLRKITVPKNFIGRIFGDSANISPREILLPASGHTPDKWKKQIINPYLPISSMLFSSHNGLYIWFFFFIELSFHSCEKKKIKAYIHILIFGGFKNCQTHCHILWRGLTFFLGYSTTRTHTHSLTHTHNHLVEVVISIQASTKVIMLTGGKLSNSLQLRNSMNCSLFM